MTLNISPELRLPVDAVTSTFGILAKKGAGKSNAAVVMAEEMWDAGVPWVAVDPKGDWWGLRSSGDGKGPGLPIVVFGGRHGDVPLEPTAGSLIADLVLEQRLTCVLDVSEFSKADVRRFLFAFADRLYRQADADPLHLFLEEAHEYLPQMVRGDDANLVNAWQRIVKQGRFKGLGCTLVSQRSASLNKDVLTQVDTLIVLRTTSPQDRAAVKAWVDVHSDHDEMLDTLPSLADGEAWVWSPGAAEALVRIKFRRRRTFDSGFTPKVGQARRAPATLADVDLAAIKEQMAETIEKAKADDPKELRRRVRELEKQLAERPAAEPRVREVQVPVVPALVVDLLKSQREALAAMADAVTDAIGRTLDAGEVTAPAPAAAPVVSRPKPTPRPAASPRAPADGDTAVTGPMRKLLTVLATYGPRTKRQLAMQAGYSAKGGGFNNPLSALRSGGLVERGDPIVITDAGLAALGDYDELPRGRALLDYWMGQLGGPEKKILQPLVDAWPNTMTKDELAAAAGYAPVGGGFNNPLSRLRTLELVTRGSEIGLTDDFAEAIAS